MKKCIIFCVAMVMGYLTVQAQKSKFNISFELEKTTNAQFIGLSIFDFEKETYLPLKRTTTDTDGKANLSVKFEKASLYKIDFENAVMYLGVDAADDIQITQKKIGLECYRFSCHQ